MPKPIVKTILRIIATIFTLFLGAISIYLEWTVNESGLFDYLLLIPFISFIIFTAIVLLLDWNKYRSTKKHKQFIPTCILLVLLVTVLGHKFTRTDFYLGKTKFIAVTPQGSDYFYKIEFKGDKHIVLTEYWMLGETYFYGLYSKRGNKLQLNIKPDFYMPQKAIISNDTIRFNNDSTFLLIDNNRK